MIVSMLHNWNVMIYSHHKILKCISFVSSHYVSVINLNIMLSFNVFREFDYVSQSIM